MIKVLAFLLAGLAAVQGCSSDDPMGMGEEERPDPGPGPHFSVSPIPLDQLARISPLGFNNKVFPIGHTYWDTCDQSFLMPTERPCLLQRLPIRAPGNGVVRSVDPQQDGGITIEGPPGLHAGFSHVTPTPGLNAGDSVRAGETIATMFYLHSFDFGLFNYGREPRSFVRPERFPDIHLYAESPLEQFPEPLRSQLAARVQTLESPFGRLSYDVAGTAAGYWFLEGTPVEDATIIDYAPNHLFLGRLQERDEIRIMVTGELWPGQQNRLVIIDPSEPSWDELTETSGPIFLRAWALARDGGPDLDRAHGTVLIEVLQGGRIRVEWLGTHEPGGDFTGQARIYER